MNQAISDASLIKEFFFQGTVLASLQFLIIASDIHVYTKTTASEHHLQMILERFDYLICR